MARDPIGEIIAYNRRFVGRYDHVLRHKLARLAADPFSFFRGTFHLFARDWAAATVDPPDIALPADGELRIVADVHGENFGTFKAADGTVRYDINDFDETTWGRFDFDCCRAATSLLLAAGQIGVEKAKATSAVRVNATTYAREIIQCAEQERITFEACSNRELPETPVARRLLQEAAGVRRADYIATLTSLIDGKRILTRGDKFFELRQADRERAKRLLSDYVRRLGDKARKEPGFYDVEDICGRTAGCGSLGCYRFAVAIAGHGDDEGKNLLLEFKEALPSGYDFCRAAPMPPQAECRAAEVADVARQMQTVSNRYLGYAVDGDASFQVREIGPRERRLEWKAVKKGDEFDGVAALHAKLVAKAHAKAALENPAARDRFLQIPSLLHDRLNRFVGGIADFAAAYAGLVTADHLAFVEHQAEVAKALDLGPVSK